MARIALRSPEDVLFPQFCSRKSAEPARYCDTKRSDGTPVTHGPSLSAIRMMRIFLAMICLTLSHAVPAQGNPAIVGDWRRVSVVQPDSVWAARLFWGPKPLGMIHYSARGVMAAQLYDEWCPTQAAVGAAGRCESTLTRTSC